MSVIHVKKGWIGGKTLNEALNEARSGDVILLAPDFYQFNYLSITQSNLTIRSADPQRKASIHGRIELTGQLRIEEIILTSNDNAINISKNGTCSLYRCDFQSSSLNHDFPLIYVNKGFAEIIQCTIHDTPSNGVWVKEGGRVTIEGCEFWNCGHPAIGGQDADSLLTVTNCLIRDTQQNGIWIHSQAQVRVEGGEIKNCTYPGVAIGSSAQGTLRNLKIHDTPSNGVWVKEGGRVTIEGCELWNCGQPAIEGRDADSLLTVTNCLIRDTQQNGIWIHSQAQVRVDGGEIKNCGETFPGVGIASSAQGTLRNLKIHDTPSNGVWVKEGGRVTIEGCELFACGDFGLAVQGEHSTANATSSIFYGNSPQQIRAKDHGSIMLSRCVFPENASFEEISTVESNGEIIPSRLQFGREVAAFSSASQGFIPSSGTAAAGNSADQALANLNAMIGLNAVKHEVEKLVNMARVQKKREASGLPVLQTSLHMVFTGNPGTGKTTVARLIGEIYACIGLLSKGHLVEVDRSKLVAGYIGQTAMKTAEAIESAKGGVLFIDEAYALAQGGDNDFGQEAIDTLLKAMEDNRQDMAVIVAGYTSQMRKFIESNPGLKSRFTRYIHFEDYSAPELFEILKQMLNKHGYVFSDVTIALEKQIKEIYDNRDENFGNARDMRKLFEQIFERQALRIAKHTDANLSQILPEDILNFRPRAAENLDEILRELDEMIGLHTVKQEIRKLAQLAKANARRTEAGGKSTSVSMHMVFSGNPGTGKTTVARLIGKIYQALGLLKSGHVIEVDRGGLVGQYVGETAQKTGEKIKNALDGILFIDEAYALVQSANAHHDFGKEAIDTILKAMEDRRDRLAVIVAGYEQPMKQFLMANEGLESRFTRYIHFDDYAPDELYEIFKYFSNNDGYKIEKNAEQAIRKRITALYDSRGDNFGNAREIRNLFQKIVESQSARIADNDADPYEINIDDIILI